jgi:hypothetical protein
MAIGSGFGEPLLIQGCALSLCSLNSTYSHITVTLPIPLLFP